MKTDWTLENSIKQMLRMPVRTGSFLVLIAAMGFLISLAAGMFVKTTANISGYKSLFKTIGTVAQKPSRTERELRWDAQIKDYRMIQNSVYDRIIPVNVLDFEEEDYVNLPEKRSYYASYSPEYHTQFSQTFNYRGSPMYEPVVEFSPAEDCIPEESVRINVTKVLFGWQSFEPSVLWFCDHYNDSPEMMYKDKTYIAALTEKGTGFAHGKLADAEIPEEKKRITADYVPKMIKANHYDAEGNSIAKDEDARGYYEVTEDFYDTPVGQRYLNYVKGLELRLHTFPVTGANSIDLLLPFYNGNVTIAEGRDISAEAYADGLSECLVSKTFADSNGLGLGDGVRTNLLYTNSKNVAEKDYLSWGGGFFDYTPLMEDDKAPEVFETKEYTIVGIYDATGFGDGDPRYQLGCDEMIVPLKSIDRKDVNIVEFGPMNEFTTSFRIPNGSIDEYMEKWEKLGIDDIEFTFYDMGYTKLEEGMKNMRFMAIVFGTTGIILGAVLLVFYSRMFIGGQKRRITIERCLGVTEAECTRSLITGAMLVLFVGAATGCVMGALASGTISALDMVKDIYDTTYTAGNIASPSEIIQNVQGVWVSPLTGILCAVLILAAGYLVLRRGIRAFLSQEPLYLVDDINRE